MIFSIDVHLSCFQFFIKYCYQFKISIHILSQFNKIKFYQLDQEKTLFIKDNSPIQRPPVVTLLEIPNRHILP